MKRYRCSARCRHAVALGAVTGSAGAASLASSRRSRQQVPPWMSSPDPIASSAPSTASPFEAPNLSSERGFASQNKKTKLRRRMHLVCCVDEAVGQRCSLGSRAADLAVDELGPRIGVACGRHDDELRDVYEANRE